MVLFSRFLVSVSNVESSFPFPSPVKLSLGPVPAACPVVLLQQLQIVIKTTLKSTECLFSEYNSYQDQWEFIFLVQVQSRDGTEP